MTWLGLFVVCFAVFCVGWFIWVRIAPGVAQLREWDRENGALAPSANDSERI